MRVIGFIVYCGIGLVQLFATMDGLEEWLGLPGFLAAIGGLVLGFLPLIGTILGFVGAIDVWGWEWWQAALLFFGSFIFFIVFATGAGILEFLTRRRPQDQYRS
jgi:hypothetical protein